MFLKSLFRRAKPDAPIRPELEEPVARRLAAEGKDPAAVASRAAEPRDVPPRPELPGFQGAVRIVFTVDGQGEVKAVALEGAPFDRVAEVEAWADRWKFQPALLDGRPHACRMVYEVTWGRS